MREIKTQDLKKISGGERQPSDLIYANNARVRFQAFLRGIWLR